MINFTSRNAELLGAAGGQAARSLLVEHQDLLNRIQAFSFDEGDCAFPFGERLARENQWSDMHAERVIREYKRFIFLAMVAGHPVTPSDEVDQVWHLHLLYTRSYWQRFCGEVLGRELHHDPTAGGRDEKSKFEHWYDRTLESYRRVFGAPPQDIWPNAAIRFGEDLHFARVNTWRNRVIPMTWVRVFYGAAVLAVLVIGPAMHIALLCP
jgi:hypothetical protein